jgi:hypothetical protein
MTPMLENTNPAPVGHGSNWSAIQGLRSPWLPRIVATTPGQAGASAASPSGSVHDDADRWCAGARNSTVAASFRLGASPPRRVNHAVLKIDTEAL